MDTNDSFHSCPFVSIRGSKTTLLGNIAFAKNPFEDTFAKGSSAFRFYKSSMDRLFRFDCTDCPVSEAQALEKVESEPEGN